MPTLKDIVELQKRQLKELREMVSSFEGQYRVHGMEECGRLSLLYHQRKPIEKEDMMHFVIGELRASITSLYGRITHWEKEVELEKLETLVNEEGLEEIRRMILAKQNIQAVKRVKQLTSYDLQPSKKIFDEYKNRALRGFTKGDEFGF